MMSTAASSRGWGPGWPNAQASKMVTIRAGGIKLSVRAEVAPIFKGFCDELVQRGFNLDRVADDWGFANRPIRGTENNAHPTPSNHSWGLAIDLNSSENPLASTHTTFPQWAIDLGEKKYGLTWGGHYSGRKDPMHWEYLGTPAQARQIVAMLAALPAAEQPPEPPHVQEDDDMTFLLTPDRGVVLLHAGRLVYVAKTLDNEVNQWDLRQDPSTWTNLQKAYGPVVG